MTSAAAPPTTSSRQRARRAKHTQSAPAARSQPIASTRYRRGKSENPSGDNNPSINVSYFDACAVELREHLGAHDFFHRAQHVPVRCEIQHPGDHVEYRIDAVGD